jgi:hypothetical protein
VHHAQSKEDNQSQVRNQSQEGACQEDSRRREEARQEGRQEGWREEGQARFEGFHEGFHEELPRDVDARLRLLLDVQRGFDPHKDKRGDP